jgi:hypothetical protein
MDSTDDQPLVASPTKLIRALPSATERVAIDCQDDENRKNERFQFEKLDDDMKSHFNYLL